MTYPHSVMEQLPSLVAYVAQLGIIFPDALPQQIFLQAFIHKSFAADLVPALPDNERLEFYGDAVV